MRFLLLFMFAAFVIGWLAMWTTSQAQDNSATTTGQVAANDASFLANLPPDPGEAGKATLEGIDSDGDGVRDDVQRWIALNFPDSEKTREALRQKIIVMQQFLLDAADSVNSYNNFLNLQKANACLAYVRPSDYYDIAIEIKAQTLNTYTRSSEWIKASHHLSGKVFDSLTDRKQGCIFDPDVMPN